MTLSRDSVCRRLCALGVRKPIVHSILNQVDTWVRSSGPEWTVERLKALKLDLVKLISGQNDLTPWISRHSDGCPKGAFRSFFKREIEAGKRELQLLSSTEPVSNRSRKLHRISVGRQKTLMVLMLYTSFVAKRATEKQLAKFYSSVQKDPIPKTPEHFYFLRLMRERISQEACVATNYTRPLTPEEREAGKGIISFRPSTLDDFTPGNTSVPLPRSGSVKETEWCKWFVRHAVDSPVPDLYPRHSKYAFSGMLDELSGVFELDRQGRLWVDKDKTKLSVDPAYHVPPCEEGDSPIHMPHVIDPRRSEFMGRIGFIQEPGFKLRAVANPNRIIQLALEPLKKGLLNSLEMSFGSLSVRRSDFTTDQSAGVNVVQGWLREGKIVHCVDLSDATNHFPLSLQVAAVESFFQTCFSKPEQQETKRRMNDYINLWESASKGLWEDRVHPEGVRWGVGQPLGLGPSFPAFAFTHNLLLSSLRREHGGEFAVLGDDVAIAGDSLHQAYRHCLKMLDCPVSEHKCLSSSRAAEFAGKVITRDAILSGYKWREVSDHSFLDHCRLLGQKSAQVLRPLQRAIYRLISEIPVELGGLGHNPRGKTLYSRILDNWSTIEMLNTTTQNEVKVVRANSQLNALRIQLGPLAKGYGITPISHCATQLLLDVGKPNIEIQPTRLDEGRLRWILELRDCAPTTPLKFEQEKESQIQFLKQLRKKIKLFSSRRESRDPRGPSQLEVLQRKLEINLKPTTPEPVHKKPRSRRR